MQRGTIIMAIGLAMQVVNWILSSAFSNAANFQSIKGTLGTVTIFGWLLFFAGFGIRQLDKKKLKNSKKGVKL
ncbi:MAG: hypothetical protein KGH89_06815 [Thaumarchaeota archaeon]|nr:hypothetical protein [Nitrososphaerota archaeon]MDE1867614.1 hypothetical protein [Nitrososphaerota archaeon]